jgi:hypothetical protein
VHHGQAAAAGQVLLRQKSGFDNVISDRMRELLLSRR